MRPAVYTFSSARTTVYYDSRFSELKKIVARKDTVLLTDEHVFGFHPTLFRDWNVIVLKAGEAFKVQDTVDAVIRQLIRMRAGRQTVLVGVGGGVITDLAGYIASVFMRGILFGFVPTSLLCMVDASIGGKNGIDVDEYKNMVGLVRQPAFILHDHRLLKTLPEREWRNGFAEIIKHACIGNASMFRELEKHDPGFYRKNAGQLAKLVRANADFKFRVVQRDEFEKGRRKLLNFGHTIGHALENQYELSHGEAVSIGMVSACHLSSGITGFAGSRRVASLIEKYGLPAQAVYNKDKMFRVLVMDKKRSRDHIHLILLEKIGRAVIQPVSIGKLKQLIDVIP
jgi:3-dehydroquinate synthase